MHRLLALVLLLASGAAAHAQDSFVAPTYRNILASQEDGLGPTATHQLFVTNASTVPIIVFGVTLTSCDNLKQPCGPRRTNIRVGPGQRRNVGSVQARDPERGYEYRWSFSFRADSSDAKVLAILQAHGAQLGEGAPHAEAAVPVASTDSTPAAPVSLPTNVMVPRPTTRAELEEMNRRVLEERERAPTTLRFKVGFGSILGSTMMPGEPVKPTGACVDPASEAKYDRDARITRTPWRPAVAPRTMAKVSLPEAVRAATVADTAAPPADLLVRFVADTGGTVIPESVSVLESPSGQLSVRACTAVMGTHLTPARDKAGHPISAWVQMPLAVQR